MKREGLSIGRWTTLCQRLLASYVEKLLKYQCYVTGLRKQHDYIFSQIGNAHEMPPVCFEMLLKTTIEKTVSSTASMLTSGNTKQRCTVLFCALANGTKVRPYVILKRKTILKIPLPAGAVVRAHENAWMNSDFFVDWIKTVWEKRSCAMLTRRSMLVLDSFRGHTTEELKDCFSSSGTTLVVVLRWNDINVAAFRCITE
uniref:Pogo transposable element with KRAB domain n=1 Tax=Rhipicephalus zambeziensis TaxID=60191 RepID=A0A224Z1H5_9ACAR